jgi:xanthine dehydrogenase accessory factor
MSFDRTALDAAVAAHGTVARVVIGAIKGSSPREVGASMLVWQDGQRGTIGGGALEYAATAAARREAPPFAVSHHALGPELGQCCGGAVSLVTERFDAARLAELPAEGLFARGPGAAPLSVARALRDARSGKPVAPGLRDGWMVEPLARPRVPLWIWGAGHVGRALAEVMAPLPGLAITLVDDAPARFPAALPPEIRALPAPDMPRAMALAPAGAHHLILTYSHEIDLALCHAALARGFASCGLIGSRTKWARFRSRLRALGHSDAQIARIACPIGDPALGKHPQAIAIGVARDLLQAEHRQGAEGHDHDRTASDA